MIHNQSTIPACKIPRSVFDLTHRHLTTFDPDYLIPFFHSDVLPGDTFNLNTNLFVRFNNIVHPIMDNLYLDTFFFFVPYRLIWDNWEKFCGYQENPGDSTDYLIPQMEIKALGYRRVTEAELTESGDIDFTYEAESYDDDVESYCYEGSLKDYFGIPLSAHYHYHRQQYIGLDYSRYEVTNEGWRPFLTRAMLQEIHPSWDDNRLTNTMIKFDEQYGHMPSKSFIANKMVNSLNFRAYNLIWNEWFRDENLQNSVNVPKGDGPDSPRDYVLLKRGKRHDYFTSCLPWPQKGPAVSLPLGTRAPVFGDGETLMLSAKNSGGSLKYYNLMYNKDDDVAGGYLTLAQTGSASVGLPAGSVAAPYPGTGTGLSDTQTVGIAPSTTGTYSLYADLSTATAATINQLREAFAVQRFYEKRARGGTRYFEILQSMFGVYNPDLRLQRPQYLGGSSQPLNIIPVVQTSASTDQSPQGNLAALSVTSAKCGFTQSFGEYGVVIGLMSVRADLTYQQGLSRFYSKRTVLDYYWPTFAFLGEQAVMDDEIYCTGGSTDELVFGYQERWAEYRYSPSRVSGYMNSNSPQSLDVWHLGQRFDSRPRLNSAFIQEDVPIGRVKMVESQPAFMCDVYNKCHAARPLPTYSVPGLLDHF